MRRILYAFAGMALSGCSLFTPSSDIKMSSTSFEGHAPPGSNFGVIEGAEGSCMPKRIMVGGAQDLEGVSGTITCTDRATGITETATFSLGKVNASASQAIVQDTANKAIGLGQSVISVFGPIAAAAATGGLSPVAAAALRAQSEKNSQPGYACPGGAPVILNPATGQPGC